MIVLFNVLAVIVLLIYTSVVVYKAITGNWVMGLKESIRNIFLYAIAYYIFLSNVFDFPMAIFIKQYFWNVPFIYWSGMVIMYISAILYIIVVFDFAENFKIGVDIDSKNLKTNGLYAYSRNPMYLVFYMFWIGAFLSFSNLGMLIILLGVMAAFHLQIIYKEEPFLKKKYGKEYNEYCKKARRYL